MINSPPGPDPNAADAETTHHSARTLRILVVDDEADIRETLAEILETIGHRVDTAQGGREALARITGTDYDAVLSDIRMPDMNGMDLYGALRERRLPLAERFIVLTGNDLVGRIREFLDQTAIPVIGKPFKPSEVRRVVAELSAASCRHSGAAAS